MFRTYLLGLYTALAVAGVLTPGVMGVAMVCSASFASAIITLTLIADAQKRKAGAR